MEKVEYGWRCPSCGAVMAPWQKACVNCSGNNNSSPITMKDNRVVIEKPKTVDYEPAPWGLIPISIGMLLVSKELEPPSINQQLLL